MGSFWFSSIVFLAVGSTSFAQPPRVSITYIEGTVDIDGQSSPRVDSVLPESSLVRTAKGRAQIRFGRGDTLFLGENSSMRVRLNEPEILTGSAVVITGGLGPAVSCAWISRFSESSVYCTTSPLILSV